MPNGVTVTVCIVDMNVISVAMEAVSVTIPLAAPSSLPRKSIALPAGPSVAAPNAVTTTEFPVSGEMNSITRS
jgi:hypothetical protein